MNKKRAYMHLSYLKDNKTIPYYEAMIRFACNTGFFQIYLDISNEKSCGRRLLKNKLTSELNDGNLIFVNEDVDTDVLKNVDLYLTDSILKSYIWRLRGRTHHILYHTPVYVIEMNAIYAEDDCIWAVADGIASHFLIKTDLITEKKEWYFIPFLEKKRGRLFSGIKRFEDLLVLLPDFGSRIILFDTEKCTFDEINVNNLSGGERLFSDVVYYQKSLYFIPRLYDKIVRYDMHSGSITYFNRNREEWKSTNTSMDYCKKGTVIGSHYFFYSRMYNSIIKLDLDDGNLEIVHNLADEALACACEIVGNTFYLVSQNSLFTLLKIVVNDRGVVLSEEPLISGESEADHPFCFSTHTDTRAFFFPGTSERIMTIDILSNEIKYFSYNEWSSDNKKDWKYSCVSEKDGFVYAYDMVNKSVLKIDEKNSSTESFAVETTEEEAAICSISNILFDGGSEMKSDLFPGIYYERLYN